ncbi:MULTISPECIES: hypothetical protein [unclassified Phaeobacter]|uniref:hypothetical protein n=3 Tax=Phaeobacter TaxID=302485 RepID=UPI003A85C06C
MAALVAVQLWARSEVGTIIPEGSDDIERRTGPQSDLISVKSRRHERGPFRPSDIREHVTQLERRARDGDARSLELVLEQDVTEDARQAVTSPISLAIIPSPREDAAAIVEERMGCWAVAAEIAVAKLQDILGDLADRNGPLPVGERIGLGAAEVERILSDALASIQHEALEEAILGGLVEAVDFNTPTDEPSFYSGVDVEPGHLAAGLVVTRPEDGHAVEEALGARNRAIICGPSGAGKSAVMWQVAKATKHTIRWYRLLRLENEDIGILNRFMGGLRISPSRPVGIVLDDAGRRLPEAWGRVLGIAQLKPGLVLLASCREEDLVRLRTADTPLLRLTANENLAKALWEKLHQEGKTGWAGWREPWASAEGLLMEYAHMLSTDTRLQEVLKEQFDDRLSDPERDLETDAVRIVSCAHASGARIDVKRLAEVLGATAPEMSRAFTRLAREHLVRAAQEGLVAPLHQLRSSVLMAEAHASGAVALSDTLGAAIAGTHSQDLSILLADIDVEKVELVDPAVSALASRINASQDPTTLLHGLKGLAFLEAKSIAVGWLKTEAAKALPFGQRQTAAALSLSDADLSGDIWPDALTNAVREFGRQMHGAKATLRTTLISKCDPDLIGRIFQSCSANEVQGILAALIGIEALPASVRSAILDHGPNPMELPFDEAVSLLETIIDLDREVAVLWTDKIAPDGLVGRVAREVPWATVPEIGHDGDLVVASCSHVHIADEIVPDAHEAVVSLCRYLFALAPQVDRADVDAIDASGVRLAIGDFEVAAKTMPRSASPPVSRTGWNRTIISAVTTSSELETRTAFLAEALRISGQIAPTLERVLDRVVRGKIPPERDLEVLGGSHNAARALTSPIGQFGDRAKGEVDAFAEVQDALFFTSADLVRRYAGLPEGANALAAYCGEKAQKLREALSDPMWSLLDGVDFGPLIRIVSILEDVRLIAWDHGKRLARASAPREQVRKAAKRNALRTASRLACRDISRTGERLLQELEAEMTNEGLTARVFLLPEKTDSVPGVASSVLVLVEVVDLDETLVAAPVVFELLRSLVPQFVGLTVVPIHADGHLLRFGIGGFENPFPMVEGESSERVEEVFRDHNIPPAQLPLHDLYNEMISTALAIGNILAADRAGEDQPQSERATLIGLEDRLGTQSEKLKTKLGGEFADLVDSALDEAQRFGLGSRDLHSIAAGGEDLEDRMRQRKRLAIAALAVDLGLLDEGET